MTYGNGLWDEQFHQEVLFRPGETENKVINLYPEIQYQIFDGFGGAITESAAYIYSLMGEEQKNKLMEAYFSPNRMNYQFVRIPIDSCDFSLQQYEASGKPDFSDFSFERLEKYILPMLDDAEKAAGHRLPIMLSPWSPPAYMKTNGKRNGGGALKPEYAEVWAEYICRYVEEYQRRGYHIAALTLQNEPKAVQTWDSCIFTAKEEKAFLLDRMIPVMERHHLEGIPIYIWDHNKERVYEWMRDIIDEQTDARIAGAAVHWYSGDHFEALDLCREKYPNKKLIVSESCIEFYKFDIHNAQGAAQWLGHEVIGDLNHGISAFFDWNLLLDENGGPNYVGNYAMAPFFYHTEKHELQPHLISQYFEHISKTVVPGSVRIACTKYTDNVEATAWKRPDGSIGVVLINRSEAVMPLCIRLNDEEADLMLFPKAIARLIIR